MARLLGVDPGTVRCGIAVSDSAHAMAFPRPALARDGKFVERLRALIEEEQVEGLVVGRPLSLAGRETPSTQSADELFEELREAFGALRVVQWDERLTSVEAGRALSQAGLKARAQRDHVDSAAAVIMLQHYLDGERG